MVHLVLQSTRRNRRSWAHKSINSLRERDVCNFSSYSDFRMSALRTPRYYGQELKSRGMRITENNSHYYGLSLLRTPNIGADDVRYSDSGLYLSKKKKPHTLAVFPPGVLEYYHASLEPIMQYPYLRTDVFQGFREIGNAILFCLQLESFLVRDCS